MHEAAVSKKLREALVSLGAVCWKLSDRFHASRPDLIIINNGRTAFIEMKLWPSIPTTLQVHTLDELVENCAWTFLIQYDRATKTFHVQNWFSKEKVYHSSAKEVAKWLLKLLS